MTKAEYNAKYAEITDDFLKYSEIVFGRVSTPNALADAMKYSFFAGGKRIRPVLTLAFGDALGLDKKVVMPFAFGLECIHTYSLIHDDLPSMDNDSLRRGKPTCHVKYGEATALLAGDALLNFAFEHILGVVSTKNEINALKCLADCSGYRGMVSGQVSDKESENATDKNENKLFETYELKTGKLLTAPFAMTALLKGEDELMPIAESIGNNFGRAFQFADDLKDVLLSSEQTGKTSGKDARERKFTSVSVYGVEKVTDEMRLLIAKTVEDLKKIQGTEFLIRLIESIDDFVGATGLKNGLSDKGK